MKSLIWYKKIIKLVFWTTLLSIAFLTFQAIYSTDNWQWFNVDFNNKDHIIGAYGTLIGGVLAFLSILFVLYQVYEQREQLILEKEESENEKKEDLKDRLLLLTNYLRTLKSDIIKHGVRMEAFFQAEKTSPSTMNTMYFNTNKNFERVIEMDILSNFRAFQLYLNNDDMDWQKQFINLYEIADFYNEAFKDLKKKYSSHIEDKVAKQKQIASDITEFLNANSRLVDDYRIKYDPDNYLNHPWSALINDYSLIHYDYLKEVQANGEVPDFRHISNGLLLSFISTAMDIRRDIGFDDLGSRNIVELASSIRKKIWEVEVYSIQYAEDIEKQFNNYFSRQNENINELERVKGLIISKI